MDDEPATDAIDGIVDDLQEHYPDLDPSGLPIVGRVLRLARHLEDRREVQLASFGLTVADFDVLASLRRTATPTAINVRELQQSLMLSSGGMTKRLDRLESSGLLERERDPNDRRGVLIGLTVAGRDLIDRALPAVLRAERELVDAAIGNAERRDQTAEGLRQLLLAEEQS
ncbi:MAG: MarR family transcriptional regulator [Acidimicrobiales bacterium]|nr:MAG: MarR family transcriptional regulator [Acidimicrobiales bacterium]